MRLLITGAGGFLGHHALRHFLTYTDWHITATDSFRHKGKTDRIALALAYGPPEWQKRVTVITHDLTAPISSQMASGIGEVDYIIAYASHSHVDRSITDPAAFIRNNTEVAITTLEYARQVNPEALIWVSTDEVYGPVQREDAGHEEWAPILPSNPYAASKAAQEAIAISYWRTYGLPVAIVNSMNLIGETQDAEKFLPMTIKRVRDSEIVTIHGQPDNIGSRHYLHARNLADAILFILRSLPVSKFPASPRPDRYNIASADRINNLDLAQMVARIMGRQLQFTLEDFHTTRPGHDPHYALDTGKLTGLGWKPPMPFTESLERTIAWSLAHPEWLL